MLSQEEWMDVQALHRAGHSVRETAAQAQHDGGTTVRSRLGGIDHTVSNGAG